VIGRVGGALAPQVLRLGAEWALLPFAVFLLVAVANTIAFAVVIPETKGRPLPEHMPDKVTWWCGWGRKKNANDDDIKSADLPTSDLL
jgi:hypothetical protein